MSKVANTEYNALQMCRISSKCIWFCIASFHILCYLHCHMDLAFIMGAESLQEWRHTVFSQIRHDYDWLTSSWQLPLSAFVLVVNRSLTPSLSHKTQHTHCLRFCSWPLTSLFWGFALQGQTISKPHTFDNYFSVTYLFNFLSSQHMLRSWYIPWKTDQILFTRYSTPRPIAITASSTSVLPHSCDPSTEVSIPGTDLLSGWAAVSHRMDWQWGGWTVEHVSLPHIKKVPLTCHCPMW